MMDSNMRVKPMSASHLKIYRALRFAVPLFFGVVQEALGKETNKQSSKRTKEQINKQTKRQTKNETQTNVARN